MELKKIHRGSDAYMVISLTNDGVRMDFSTMSDIMVAMYADNQKAFAGKCEVIATEGESMRVLSPAEHQRYIGPYRLVLTCTFEGRTATYDALAFDVVATSAEVDAQGMTTEQETSDIGIDLTVEDVSSSLVQEIVSAAVKATEGANSAAENAVTATEGAIKATEGANASASLAEEKASLAEEKATLANDAAGRVDSALNEYAGKIIEQDAVINEAILEQNEQIEKKADKDGYYPDLTSGFADDLVGRGESVPAEFSFRATGGKSIKDGTARIKELRGNAVVWNQQLHNATLDEQGVWRNNKASAIYSNGEVTITANDKFSNLYQTGVFYTGHKYLVSTEIKSSNTSSININFAGGYDNVIALNITENYQRFTHILTLGKTKSDMFQIYALDSTAVWSVRKCLLYDLTKMFGSGNEPTTIEDFYSRCPLGVDMNAYNEGEMIADNSTAIKSIGDNAWDEQWESGGIVSTSGNNVKNDDVIRSVNYIRVIEGEEYYINALYNTFIFCYDKDKNFLGLAKDKNGSSVIYNESFIPLQGTAFIRFYTDTPTYNNDITISLYHSGWKAEVDNVYKPYVEDTLTFDQRILDAFPNGRRPWDKVYNKNGKGYIVKGTGEVDLGTLNWVYNNAEGQLRFYTPALSDIKGVSATLVANAISAKYLTATWNTMFANAQDKVIAIHSGGNVGVYDTAYTDAATFKTAMSGVMLWYELAEPEIIEYDEPFNLDYEVWDFGTEQSISDNPSAPIDANIIYQFNAVDMIRDHEARIAKLEALIVSLTNA